VRNAVILIFLALLSSSCATDMNRPNGAGEVGHAGGVEAVAAVLDDWHVAASEADEERYFSHFAPAGVFLGTDAGERWTVDEFQAYARPHFSEGRGWTYLPSDRHVVLSEDDTVAWFDESLQSEKYGQLRGTGVLRKIAGEWKLAQYNMTFTIPNDVAPDVVALIRGDRPVLSKDPNTR
jgi:ketosteroid isomerase-like protein